MEEQKKQLCHGLMTTDVKMEQLLLQYFEAEDFHKIEERRIGGGKIGGKACGLLLAQKLIHLKFPEYEPHIEPHDSFFIGSDVFYEYLRENDCQQQREKMLNGTFTKEVEEGLLKVVKHYREVPIIVRSSSFLEDGFGNAFSGKYESKFCINNGNEGGRLQELKDAIRSVYASTLNPSAIEYCRRRGLLEAEEQMALLIQKVEGQKYDTFYMPVAAGMGCSYNPYKWMENMNPEAGMIRMVMGLGTRAVERTPGDYPRLVCLDRAQANLRTTIADRHKFSQRQVDVIDYITNTCRTKKLREVIEELPEWQKKLVLSHDTEAEFVLRQRGENKNVYFADCQGMVNKNTFIEMVHRILKMLEAVYERPVDIEFAVNSTAKGEWKINFLQCRPLQSSASEEVHIPTGKDEELLFDVRRTSMRRSKTEHLDLIVWVHPKNYYEYPHIKKMEVARKIGDINQQFKSEHKKMLLLVPGRIGTSSPELGVPVTYADISQFCAICEVAYGEAGYHPDLSYGSHMFQDLVEADVYYGALNDNSKTRIYRPELLENYKNLYPDIWPEDTELTEIIKVYDVSAANARLLLDMKAGRAVCHLETML